MRIDCENAEIAVAALDCFTAAVNRADEAVKSLVADLEKLDGLMAKHGNTAAKIGRQGK